MVADSYDFYLKKFSENFSSDTPSYLLFWITGEQGSGKSTLVRKFENLGKENNAIVITCNDEQRSPVSVMGYIAQKLTEFNISSKEFDNHYAEFCDLRDQIEVDPKAPRRYVDLVVHGMTEFAIKAARLTPGAGIFVEYEDEKEVSAALMEGRIYLADKFGNKDQIKLLREPERILTPTFIDMLNNASKKHRVVLMFNEFELTYYALELWLLEFLNFKFGELKTGTTFVVSGRNPINERWSHIAEFIFHITLGPPAAGDKLSNLLAEKNNKKISAVFGKPKVFISYSREDFDVANEIYAFLNENGCIPWMDRYDLIPGQDWELEINRNIKMSDFFVACLSNNSVSKRGYVQKELKHAISILEQFPEGEIFLIPIRISECVIPEALASRQWLDWFAVNSKKLLLKAIQSKR